MPEFGNPFAGMTPGRKLTRAELVRAVRFLIAAEYEAVQLYMQLAEATDDQLAQTVLKDVADEEIVHAGEFLALLKELAPEESAFYAEGEREVREMMAGLGGRTAEVMAGKGVAEAQEAAAEIRQAEPPGVGNLFHS